MLSVLRFCQSAGERAGVSRSPGYRVAVPAFASPERPDTHVFAGSLHACVVTSRKLSQGSWQNISAYCLLRLSTVHLHAHVCTELTRNRTPVETCATLALAVFDQNRLYLLYELRYKITT